MNIFESKEDFLLNYINNDLDDDENFIVLSDSQYKNEDGKILINCMDRYAARKYIDEDGEIKINVSTMGGGCRFHVKEIASNFHILNRFGEFFICDQNGKSQLDRI